MRECFVIDPLISKREQLLLATQLCRMVLKVSGPHSLSLRVARILPFSSSQTSVLWRKQCAYMLACLRWFCRTRSMCCKNAASARHSCIAHPSRIDPRVTLTDFFSI